MKMSLLEIRHNAIFSHGNIDSGGEINCQFFKGRKFSEFNFC